MRNFIIFFQEKEGSSPIIRILDNFPGIAVIHDVSDGVGGWEPFDTYNSGGLRLRDLSCCLNELFGSDLVDVEALNQIYTRTSRRPLKMTDDHVARGFKMRFKAPVDIPGLSATAKIRKKRWFGVVSFLLRRLNFYGFKRLIFEQLRKHNLVVFVLVRQDIFRWALSRYHGDGTGRRGHLQFELARGKIRREDISKISVNRRRMRRLLYECERSHSRKRHLIALLKTHNVDVFPLFYEDFVQDKPRFFRSILANLEVETTPDQIALALEQGTVFRKVHSDDISTFVVNHAEITSEFGQYRHPWKESFACQDAEDEDE